MNRNKSLILMALGAALSAFACSGPPVSGTGGNGGGGGGGGTGNATVGILLTAAPTSTPPNANILSFSVTIGGISLTPASGTAVNVTLNTGSSAYTVDLTRLQSDSAFLGPQSATPAVTIPAGTYNSITLTLQNPVVTYCTTSSTGQGCAANSVQTASVTTGIAAPVITFTQPLTVASGAQTGIALNFNMSSAFTVNSTTQVVSAVNLGAANLITASTLPPSSSSLATGQLGFVEDVFGNVSAVSGQSVTVQTTTLGSITATANATSSFSPDCIGFSRTQTFQGCVKLGDVASIDTTLNKDGTFTLLNYDPIDSATHDWVEGTIAEPATTLNTTQVQIVANALVPATSNSVISGKISLAQPVTVVLPPTEIFEFDNNGLFALTGDSDLGNFSSASALAPGQSVAFRVSSLTTINGITNITANLVDLRFTRVTGVIATPPSQTGFSIQNLPPFFGVTTMLQVALSSSGAPPNSINTNYEGTSPTTPSSNYTVGQLVSMRAMYVGISGNFQPLNPFVAAKIRLP